MRYNRKTLEELNGILLDSSNEIINTAIIMNCFFPLKSINIFIFSQQGRIFTVEAVINDVNTRYGWYYISCSENNCKKLLEIRIDYYYRSKCDIKAQPKPRQRV